MTVLLRITRILCLLERRGAESGLAAERRAEGVQGQAGEDQHDDDGSSGVPAREVQRQRETDQQVIGERGKGQDQKDEATRDEDEQDGEDQGRRSFDGDVLSAQVEERENETARSKGQPPSPKHELRQDEQRHDGQRLEDRESGEEEDRPDQSFRWTEGTIGG